jgi:GNAT superfamily N-acetyltransferase
MRVRPLSAADVEAATDVLSESFHDYPVMRWVIGGSGPEYKRRLRRLIGYFVDARILRDEPLLGVDSGPDLAAVAMISYPDGPASPDELAARRESVWTDLGSEARGRYETFGAAFAPLLVTVPHIHLNMIGVRREERGRGYGQRLLESVHAHSATLPGSRGVSLTTEDPANLPLYAKFGYEQTGHAVVADGLETWAFFRPDAV